MRKSRCCAFLSVHAICSAVLFSGMPVYAAEALAVFHVGNSLTDQAYGMHDIAAARDKPTKFVRHMIPGAPLDWLWKHRDEGFRQADGKKPAASQEADAGQQP